MRAAIVSTSIHLNPDCYAKWAQQGHLIVAGDVNAPPDLGDMIRDLGGEYLAPADQESWVFSDSLGWKCIQRRNAAVMEAYQRGYAYVATVDDDNAPIDGTWLEQHIAHINNELPRDTVYVRGDRDWVDIGMFNDPRTKQRGTPHGVVKYHSVATANGKLGSPVDIGVGIVVSTAQVIGDPDCDAVSRVVGQRRVESVARNVVTDVDQWAAFNSQATVWRGDWAPLICCLPNVGRYDDIIASLIAKKIMQTHNVSFYAGEPCVVQDRNQHDFIADLRNEVWGMENTPYIVRALDGIKFDDDHVDPLDAYRVITRELAHILPSSTIRFMDAWAQAWQAVRWR